MDALILALCVGLFRFCGTQVFKGTVGLLLGFWVVAQGAEYTAEERVLPKLGRRTYFAVGAALVVYLLAILAPATSVWILLFGLTGLGFARAARLTMFNLVIFLCLDLAFSFVPATPTELPLAWNPASSLPFFLGALALLAPRMLTNSHRPQVDDDPCAAAL